MTTDDDTAMTPDPTDDDTAMTPDPADEHTATTPDPTATTPDPTDEHTEPDLDLIEGPTSAATTARGSVDATDDVTSDPADTTWTESSQPQPEPMLTPPPPAASAGSSFSLHHLIFGVLFIAIGVFGLGGSAEADVQWIWVGLLGGAGLAGLAAVVGSIRSARS